MGMEPIGRWSSEQREERRQRCMVIRFLVESALVRQRDLQEAVGNRYNVYNDATAAGWRGRPWVRGGRVFPDDRTTLRSPTTAMDAQRHELPAPPKTSESQPSRLMLEVFRLLPDEGQGFKGDSRRDWLRLLDSALALEYREHAPAIRTPAQPSDQQLDTIHQFLDDACNLSGGGLREGVDAVLDLLDALT